MCPAKLDLFLGSCFLEMSEEVVTPSCKMKLSMVSGHSKYCAGDSWHGKYKMIIDKNNFGSHSDLYPAF